MGKNCPYFELRFRNEKKKKSRSSSYKFKTAETIQS